jgi:nitroimidazol reductase NimA-like FMN-containing flavoprotein (pyridoxamine 5'-phosphate oxidase superfamily)
MLIQELTRQANLDFLSRMTLARLACTQGAQPYIVPIYFAYHDNCLYSFSTVGQKIEWMRANPLVCVQVDEVMSPQKWVSVIVFGRFEELPDASEWESARALAHELLQRRAAWWEPGYVKTILNGKERALIPVYYRIHIVKITGHQGTLDSVNAA